MHLTEKMKNDTQDIGREKKETSFVVVERLPSLPTPKVTMLEDTPP